MPAAYSHGQVTLTWTAPTDGGSVITDYRVEAASGSGLWVVVSDGASNATPCLVTGLVDGQRYRFRVSAINKAGVGPGSRTRTATPL